VFENGQAGLAQFLAEPIPERLSPTAPSPSATIADGKLLDGAGGSEHFFGARAYADVFGEILPAHDAGAVDEELCRTGDVVAIGSPCDMQEIVTADYV
jgi:hypothetical protein